MDGGVAISHPTICLGAKMKGVILAGGLGTRLAPLTNVTNKHLLPVYDKPMIFYPIETLVAAGITDILIIVSGSHAGNFIPILKNGQDFGLSHLEYAFQDTPDGGIADALSLARNFAAGGPITVILGDNTTDANIKPTVERFGKFYTSQKPRAHLFLKQVNDPSRYGIANVRREQIISLEEKPKNPQSNYAVTGLYIYDSHVFDFIDRCCPSQRNELEITDVNNLYLSEGFLTWSRLDGFWIDAGTFASLFKANEYWFHKSRA